MVDAHDIRLQGNVIASVSNALQTPGTTIGALDLALRSAAEQAQDLPEKGVTIMGDREIPYALLKKIMMTCARAGYPDLSLAVNQKAAQNDS